MMNSFKGFSPLVALSLPLRHHRGNCTISIFKTSISATNLPSAVSQHGFREFAASVCKGHLHFRQHFQNTKSEKSRIMGFQVPLHKLTLTSKVLRERFSCHRKHKELKISWYHSIQIPVQCYVISATILQSRQLI